MFYFSKLLIKKKKKLFLAFCFHFILKFVLEAITLRLYVYSLLQDFIDALLRRFLKLNSTGTKAAIINYKVQD